MKFLHTERQPKIAQSDSEAYGEVDVAAGCLVKVAVAHAPCPMPIAANELAEVIGWI